MFGKLFDDKKFKGKTYKYTIYQFILYFISTLFNSTIHLSAPIKDWEYASSLDHNSGVTSVSGL